MKIFKSFEFMAVTSALQDCEARCRELKRIGASDKPNEDLLNVILGNLKRLEALCLDVELKGALAKVELINEHLRVHHKSADYSSLVADLRNTQDMIASDFLGRKFAQIDERFSSYINNDNLLGAEVREKFKSAIPDIREAGNCIATDCGTAAVFHLMRAVECGLRALCIHLGVKRVRRSNKPKDQKYVAIEWAQWEKMLNSAEAKANGRMGKLGPGKRKQDLQEFYVPIFQDIRGFKDAFRNHVMHSRRTYTQKEADAILDHVKRFMSLLAMRVSE